jgi:hypothetical protein
MKAVQQSGQDERRVQDLIRAYEHYDDIIHAEGFSYDLSIRDGLALVAKSAKSGGFDLPQTADGETTSGNHPETEFSSDHNSTDPDDPSVGATAEGQAVGTDADVPEELRPVFASVGLFETAARKAKAAAAAIQAAEESPAYKALEAYETQIVGKRNLTKQQFSGVCFVASQHFDAIKPGKACPECKGIKASQDADLCTTCGGQGFLIADEVSDD